MLTVKQKLQAVAFVASCSLFGGAAYASGPLGCYAWETGKISASISLPKILSFKLASPAVGLFGLSNSFSADNSFVMSIPLISSLGISGLPSDLKGLWQGDEKGGYAVNVTDITDLVAMLQSLGINAQVTNVFKGVTLNDGQGIKGTYILGVVASIPTMGTAKIKLSGAFTGQRNSLDPCPPSSEDGSGGGLFGLFDAAPVEQQQQGNTSVAGFAEKFVKVLFAKVLP